MGHPRFKTALEPLTRKVMAFDLGSSHVKAILAEERLGRVRVLHHQVVDLQEEGLLSQEEVNRHLRKLVKDFGDHPVALTLPQHHALSHLVDLPRLGEREIEQIVEQESLNLSGLSEAAIVYDYHPLRPHGRHPNPYWITIAREQEAQNQINRLATEEEPCTVQEITTPANALIAACLAHQPQTHRLVLVDLGATCTVVVILDHGQAVYTTTFPIGSESFTSAIASLKKCAFEEAELIKRNHNLFTGPRQLPGFLSVVDIWQQDLERLLTEWREANPELNWPAQAFHIWLSGGGVSQPGLLEYLRTKPQCDFELWPPNALPARDWPAGRMVIAYGLVLQSLRRPALYASLLPPPFQQARRRQQRVLRASLLGAVLLLLLLLLLGSGLLAKLWSIQARRLLIADAEAALRRAQTVESLIQQREQEYARTLPLLDRQKRTLDTLRILRVLQRVRATQDLWFVLLADAPSYFQAGTVRPPETNAPGSPPPPRTLITATSSATNATNVPALEGHYLVEFNLAERAGDKQRVLKELVAELKQQPLFHSVDSLPAGQRTNLVDPKLLLPDRNFALRLELAERELPPPILAAPRKPEAARSGAAK